MMKNHLITIILLLIAVIAFITGLFTNSRYQMICDITAFVLPTLAAIVEMVLSNRGAEHIEEELKKRMVTKALTQEEYDNLKEEGKIDKDTLYLTI